MKDPIKAKAGDSVRCALSTNSKELVVELVRNYSRVSQ